MHRMFDYVSSFDGNFSCIIKHFGSDTTIVEERSACKANPKQMENCQLNEVRRNGQNEKFKMHFNLLVFGSINWMQISSIERNFEPRNENKGKSILFFLSFWFCSSNEMKNSFLITVRMRTQSNIWNAHRIDFKSVKLLFEQNEKKHRVEMKRIGKSIT